MMKCSYFSSTLRSEGCSLRSLMWHCSIISVFKTKISIYECKFFILSPLINSSLIMISSPSSLKFINVLACLENMVRCFSHCVEQWIRTLSFKWTSSYISMVSHKNNFTMFSWSWVQFFTMVATFLISYNASTSSGGRDEVDRKVSSILKSHGLAISMIGCLYCLNCALTSTFNLCSLSILVLIVEVATSK